MKNMPDFVETVAVIKYAANVLINEHLESAFKDKAKLILRMADDIAARHNAQPHVDEVVASMRLCESNKSVTI